MIWAENCSAFQANIFSEIVSILGKRGNSVLLECDDLYSSLVQVRNVCDVPILSLKSSELHLAELQMARILKENGVVVNGVYFARALGNSSQQDHLARLSLIIGKIQAMEWYGTVWSREDPDSLIVEFLRKGLSGRLEPYFFNNMTRFDAMFFLGPSHNHIEIMTVSVDFAQSLLVSIQELLPLE